MAFVQFVQASCTFCTKALYFLYKSVVLFLYWLFGSLTELWKTSFTSLFSCKNRYRKASVKISVTDNKKAIQMTISLDEMLIFGTYDYEINAFNLGTYVRLTGTMFVQLRNVS